MELVSNQHADFTRWIVNAGLLHEHLAVLDVGVQGGENARWHALGDHLVLHGFDPLETVVQRLQSANRRPNVTYHSMALGNIDGTLELFINEADPYSSSMYRHGESRFSRRAPSLQVRQVPVRTIDSLIDDGTIPQPDFVKIDVEGFEGDVLLGGARHLDGLCGLEVESNFGISCIYPKTHFGMMMSVALAHKLFVFDLEFNRVPTASFQEALALQYFDAVLDQISVGKPATLNVLFARDLIQETDHRELYESPLPALNIDLLIKQMAIFELYGLNDLAIDLGRRFATALGERLDIDKAVNLLTDPHCRVAGGRSAVRAKLEFETAQQLALDRRIAQLEDVGEAERLAARERIEELQTELAAYRRAHAATVDRMMEQWSAERWAAEKRIEELQAQTTAFQGAAANFIHRFFARFSARTKPSYLVRAVLGRSKS